MMIKKVYSNSMRSAADLRHQLIHWRIVADAQVPSFTQRVISLSNVHKTDHVV